MNINARVDSDSCSHINYKVVICLRKGKHISMHFITFIIVSASAYLMPSFFAFECLFLKNRWIKIVTEGITKNFFEVSKWLTKYRWRETNVFYSE